MTSNLPARTYARLLCFDLPRLVAEEDLNGANTALAPPPLTQPSPVPPPPPPVPSPPPLTLRSDDEPIEDPLVVPDADEMVEDIDADAMRCT